MYYFVNKKNFCQICTRAMCFYFTYLCTFVQWNWKVPLIKIIEIFNDKWKMMSDLNMSHEKMSDFASFSLFSFTLVLNLWNVDFESLWNTWIFFDKKRYGVKFEYLPWKMSHFVPFPLLGFTCRNWVQFNLRNVDFEGH